MLMEILHLSVVSIQQVVTHWCIHLASD